jgi:2-polyprenyl-6-hydroxyphenyl methylase/3-demethylubiquinone-9 3-methyltransferase
VARAFNGKAGDYSRHREGDPAFEGEAAEIARMLPLPPGRLLEVGCGVGITARRFAEAGWTVIASDVSMEMVRRASAASSSAAPIAGALRCDVRHLPFRGGSAGAVVCHGVLEYVAGIEGTVGELRRVIEPGGVLVATIPSRLSPAIWAAAVLGLAARRRRGRGPAARLRARHLFPGQLDAIARSAGLVRRGATTATFALLPPAFFPRKWLAANNAMMRILPRSPVFRWWGAQYVARYDKPR